MGTRTAPHNGSGTAPMQSTGRRSQ
jgi:hypothetical protein